MKKRVLLVLSVLVLALLSLVGIIAAQEGEEETEAVLYEGRYTFELPAGFELNESLTTDLVRADGENGTIVVAGPLSYARVVGNQEFESEADALTFYLDRTGYAVGEETGTMRMVEGVIQGFEVTLPRRGTDGLAYLIDLENDRNGVVISLGDVDPAAVETLLTSIDFPADVVDVAIAADDFNTLVAAVQEAGLEATLRDGDATYTVFAPTDAAFEALLDELDMSAEDLLASTDLLTAVLQYHVADSIVLAPTELTMLNGETVTGSLSLNEDVNVVTANIEAYNGVIHVIDRVLVPQAALDILAEMEAEAEATPEATEAMEEMEAEATEEATEESDG